MVGTENTIVVRKAWVIVCVRRCVWSGLKFEVGDRRVFYSRLKRDHFLARFPSGCFECLAPQ